MASLTRLLPIIVLLILGFLSISSSATRPCRTFIVTSYTITFKPSMYRNPNFISLDLTTTDDSSSSTIQPRSFLPDATFLPPWILQDKTDLRDSRHFHKREDQIDGGGVFGMFDSLRDRTKDVLSVVFALLLGVGCGALTAGAMYLLWVFFSGSYCVAYDSEDGDDEDDDDISKAKKIGYVMIPAAEVDSIPPPKQVDITIQPVNTKFDDIFRCPKM